MSVREISASTLSQAVYELFLDACVVPCQDVLDALAVAQEEETGAACPRPGGNPGQNVRDVPEVPV